ncbi:PilZ domain-containing protein [Sphingomonas sp. LY54]|uniref:PilZ domain-containing protein n=1 Tax=Sphingomonas sp. LY54 TaxID=3095343 RepID=UPI002D76912E|nr:PilZ domain-containing protein [Sphingomonas sp. LY54]WRP28550.1 PilZ domain-containing protein [Sphingomonas sp. LY54]
MSGRSAFRATIDAAALIQSRDFGARDDPDRSHCGPEVHKVPDKTTAASGAATRQTRRTAARDSLFLSATIQRAGEAKGDLQPLRVRNLSAIGLMADYLDIANPGEPVVVTVRGIGSVSGKVAWVKRGRIGVNFDNEVDPLKARRPVVKQAPPQQRPL